jgi:hypothetical protein
VSTDVSEERIASIFRVEGKIRKSAGKASVRDVKSRPVCYKYVTVFLLALLNTVETLAPFALSSTIVQD